MPRDHHFAFAKQVLPQEVFRNPDRVFAELRGPMREPFLFFLWQELGKKVPAALPHCAPGLKEPGGYEELITLEVVGADVRHGTEIVLVQLPPPEQPNEAWYVALLRNAHGVRVFTWERSAEGDAVLAEIKPDSRANFGFYPNWSLAGFADALSELAGVPLHDLPKPTSTPMDAVRAQGVAGGAARPATGLGQLVAKLAVARAVIGLFFGLAGWVAPGAMYELGPGFHQLTTLGTTLLSIAVGIAMLVWLYRVFSEMKGRTHYSPAFAVGSWFIPVANIILPAFVLKDAWRASRGTDQGSGLVYAFWGTWLVETLMSVLGGTGGMGEPSPLIDLWLDLTIDILADPMAAMALFSLFSTAVLVASYLLLSAVVRKISVDP